MNPDDWDYEVRMFYGRNAEPPKIQGDCATYTQHKEPESKNNEVCAGVSRRDIGRVEVRNLKGDQLWKVVFQESTYIATRKRK